MTLARVRNALYIGLPILATILMSVAQASGVHAVGWVALAAAVGGPVLAFVKAPTADAGITGRRALYALVAAVQIIVTSYGLTTGHVGEWLPIVVGALGALAGVPASNNTATTPRIVVEGTVEAVTDAVDQLTAAGNEAAQDFVQRMWPNQNRS